jgi:hypothetical protein
VPPRRRRPIPTIDLTASDVISARAEYVHELNLRTVGPAVVLVAERDAPLRMEVLADTHGEHQALVEFVRRDPRVAELLDTCFAYGEPDLFLREDAHATRLEKRQPLSTFRVVD